MVQSAFDFGPFQFDAQQMLLLRDGEPLPLGQRGAAILFALLGRRGDVVSRADLIDAVWPGAAVEDSNLSVHVAKIRKLIGPTEWIRTVERVGYRFVPEARTVARTGKIETPFPELTILPFVEAGSEDSVGSVEATLADDLTVALTRFKSLRILPPSARDAIYRDGGRGYVLTGTTHVGGGKTTAKLIDHTSGATIWAQSYAGAGGNAAQGMAEAIAASVEAEVHLAEIDRARRDPDGITEPYYHYLQGRRLLLTSRQDDNAAAHEHLQRAIALEPENATFLGAASEALHHRIVVGWPALETAPKRVTKEIVRRGVDRAGSDAVSLGLFGITMFPTDEESLGYATAQRAAEMNPNSVLVLVCASLTHLWGGDLDESEALALRARQLAPTDPNQRFALQQLAGVAFVRRDFAQSLSLSLRSLAHSPGLSPAHWTAIVANAHLGRQEEAERALARYMRISPGVTIKSIEAGQHFADRSRLTPLLDGLRLAGMPER